MRLSSSLHCNPSRKGPIIWTLKIGAGTTLNYKNLRIALPPIVTITLALSTLTISAIAAASSVITVTGSAGSFGTLGATTPTDVNAPQSVSVSTSSPASWGFGAGESAWFTTLTNEHELAIANLPQSGNPLEPTADHMAVSMWNPAATPPFVNFVIPTSTGMTTALQKGSTLVGGADVEDVQDIPARFARPERIAFTSAAPYWNWDPLVVGEYPTLGFLKRTTKGWQYDQATSKTAEQIAASTRNTALADSACPVSGSIRDCKGFTEIALLPVSNDLVVTQYFPNSGLTSGGIVVLSPTGALLARYQYPQVSAPGNSTQLSIAPREVKSDPTGTRGNERFVVIFDTYSPTKAPLPFAAQEFVFNSRTKQITPGTIAFRSDQTGNYAFSTSLYDSSGNLWLAQHVSGALNAGPLLRYTRAELNTCAPGTNWTQNYGQTCAPHDNIAESKNLGDSTSLDEDTATHDILNTTLAGYLQVIAPSGSTYQQKLVINLGLGVLVNRFKLLIGPHKGTVDATNRLYYIPIQEMQNDVSNNSSACGYGHTPATPPCPPPLLNQWLYTVDLFQLLGS